MKRTPISPDLNRIPDLFRPLMEKTAVFDSSCSREARVYYLDRDGGLFLKTAPKGTLEAEARMTRYFHSKGLGAEVLAYHRDDRDWLLTQCLPGEDCTHPAYTSDPVRLAQTLALQLRQLHELDPADCPVGNRNEIYLETARQGYLRGNYENDLFATMFDFSSPEEAYALAQQSAPQLKSGVLLHGDYCLPNILLDNWKFTGFIDLGDAGIGDRHIDLLWGVWTLYFNLHTHHYRDRFLDAYGREKLDSDILRAVAALEVLR